MKVKHESSLTDQKVDLTGFKTKVTALAYTSDSSHLAVATGDRVIAIFSTETNERVDRLSTKANNKGPKDYLITALHFEPEAKSDSSCKLAVGQSDSAVFVYKWSDQARSDSGGSIFQGKKSIVNKFLETSAVVSIVWPRANQMQCVYALMNGKIKIGNLRSNKSHLLYAIESNTVSLAINARGTELLSGHSNGSIYKYTFSTLSQEGKGSKFVHHSQPPYLLTWGKGSICAGGISQIAFYDENGNEEQVEDGFVIADESEKYSACTISCKSPNGEYVVVGTTDKFYIYGKENGRWIKLRTKIVENMLSVTSLAWKPNGSAIAIGSASGLLDIYSTTWRQYRYKNVFEVTHISPTEVLVHDIETPNTFPIAIQSSAGEEIIDLEIYPALGSVEFRYIVAKTQSTLILCDMASTIIMSQITFNWKNGNEKEMFVFQDKSACIVYFSGEITIVQYGENTSLGSFRTQYFSPDQVSLRLNDAKDTKDGSEVLKRIAYLQDEKTICIVGLGTSQVGGTFSIYHGRSVDFIELSENCAYCLFRDVNRDLYIVDNRLKTKTHFLASCTYTQWVPLSDIVLAQSEQSMHVWYNASQPEQVVLREIQGRIVSIERKETNIEIIAECDSSTISYSLPEEYTQFNDALDIRNLESCVNLLGKMEDSPFCHSLWKQILHASLQCFDLEVAHLSAVALSDHKLAEAIQVLAQSKEDEHRVRFKLCELISSMSSHPPSEFPATQSS